MTTDEHPSQAEIEAEIERSRQELFEAVRDLGDAAGEELDLRTHIARHPYGWLAGAFVVGFLFGVRR